MVDRTPPHGGDRDEGQDNGGALRPQRGFELPAGSGGGGGYVFFLGKVRNENHGRRVKKLIYEAYPEMAVKEMERIRREALQKFPILDMLIWHRYGELEVGQDTILIIASGRHRKEAFEACSWAIDEVKRRVPVWKKEVTDEGTFWIEGDRIVPEG